MFSLGGADEIMKNLVSPGLIMNSGKCSSIYHLRGSSS